VRDQPSPYTGTTPVAPLARVDGAVTLVEGQTFCLSGRVGDLRPDLPHGLFVLDTRVLSTWTLHVNGHPLEPLTVDLTEAFAARFVGRAHPELEHGDSSVVCFRERYVGQGMRERIELTNYGTDPIDVEIELTCDVDFADLFEVKEQRVRPHGERTLEPRPHGLRFGHRNRLDKVVDVDATGDPWVSRGSLWWRRTLGPRETFSTCVQVTATVGGEALPPRFTCDGQGDERALPAMQIASWRATLPAIDTDHVGFSQALRRAADDLGSLRIFDPDHPDTPIVAAGAPWFMTVFGRDSLLTAWMTLLADCRLAAGVLETLARFQGRDVNPETEEEPGKILHEMRFGAAARPSLGAGEVYYGSIDATPLFVMLLGELRRWGLADAVVERLLPHADRALAWIEEHGDRDGDGYVEYARSSAHGLANQGWKDSWDAIRAADGRFADAPIALCEVQGYVYAAYLARAHFAEEAGDHETRDRYQAKAIELFRRFNEDFWLEDRGWYALALDADKRPVDALASNMGHCLWTGIVDPAHAARVAEHLVGPDLFSGWGVRTLARSMAAYNPVSYHNGSVWPHDNAIVAAGLMRYGFVEAAHRIIAAQLDVADALGDRLPELFAGFDRDRPATPAAYPTSCSPQAWASASPLMWLRTLLRLDPAVPFGEVRVDPALPPWIRWLRVADVEMGGVCLTVEVDGQGCQVSGAPGLAIVSEPRAPIAVAAADARGDGSSTDA
jgi:glycogen debranching enzyme